MDWLAAKQVAVLSFGDVSLLYCLRCRNDLPLRHQPEGIEESIRPRLSLHRLFLSELFAGKKQISPQKKTAQNRSPCSAQFFLDREPKDDSWGKANRRKPAFRSPRPSAAVVRAGRPEAAAYTTRASAGGTACRWRFLGSPR